MIILWGLTQHVVQVLLDTGCSVPLISTRITEQLNIPRICRSEAAPLLNCSGEEVKGAGMEYTKPLRLQHRKHYSRDVFEVAPWNRKSTSSCHSGGLRSTPPRVHGTPKNSTLAATTA